MSKSRGTFIKARTYLDVGLNPEYLRYYFAAKLGPGVVDIDLNLEDFVARVNSDLVGKYVNIASRCAGFIEKMFGGKLAPRMHQPEAWERAAAESQRIAEAYERREFGEALRSVMALADGTNEAIQRDAPWLLAKDESARERLHQVCTTYLNLFRLLTLYLKPILPDLAGRAELFLNVPPLTWEHAAQALLDCTIRPYQPLVTRIDPAQIKAMVEASKEDLEPRSKANPSSQSPPAGGGGAKSPSPLRPRDVPVGLGGVGEGVAATAPIAGSPITIDDFNKIELRIARIDNAEPVAGADKLLKLTLDLGELGKRQVFAGIKSQYAPETLIGRLTVVVANLAPRKMRFGLSEGMVLAASHGDGEPFLLSPDSGAKPGMRVK
jgi:methionyl-tRNA synthetase